MSNQQPSSASVELSALPSNEIKGDNDGITDSHQVTTSDGGYCSLFQFKGCTMAKAYNTLGLSRGGIVMSNIFLSSALLCLAREEAGCVCSVPDSETIIINGTSVEIEVDDECNGRAYGMTPAALLSNIAIITGLLSAILMPFAGAMIDYTPHRRLIGILTAALVIFVQAVQIGITSKTWFVMFILQGLNGFFYQIQVLAGYAYLPDIGRKVDHETMNVFSSTFTASQFAAQILYLALVLAVSIGFGFNDVQTGQFGQAFDVLWSGTLFYMAWRLFPNVPALNKLPEGKKSIFVQSFVQVFHTVKTIQQKYKRSLRWYFLAVAFAESTTNAFTVLAVGFLSDQLQMSGTEIGMFFIITLIGTLPGAYMGSLITKLTGPSVSWRLSMVSLAGLATIGGLMLSPDTPALSYLWGVVVGMMLGWFYPVEALYFALMLPKNQEAEYSGFFVYCTQILSWLPPLIFSLIVETGVKQSYGLIVVQSLYVVAIGFVSLMAPWDECLEEVKAGTSNE